MPQNQTKIDKTMLTETKTMKGHLLNTKRYRMPNLRHRRLGAEPGLSITHFRAAQNYHM